MEDSWFSSQVVTGFMTRGWSFRHRHLVDARSMGSVLADWVVEREDSGHGEHAGSQMDFACTADEATVSCVFFFFSGASGSKSCCSTGSFFLF